MSRTTKSGNLTKSSLESVPNVFRHHLFCGSCFKINTDSTNEAVSVPRTPLIQQMKPKNSPRTPLLLIKINLQRAGMPLPMHFVLASRKSHQNLAEPLQKQKCPKVPFHLHSSAVPAPFSGPPAPFLGFQRRSSAVPAPFQRRSSAVFLAKFAQKEFHAGLRRYGQDFRLRAIEMSLRVPQSGFVVSFAWR